MLFRMTASVVVALAISAIFVAPASAKTKPKPKPMTAAGYIARDGLDKGVRNYVTAKLKYRPYFMGSSEKACTAVSPVPAGYEGIPVVDCTYSDSGLDGWVRLAVPDTNLMSDWILKAASLCTNPNRCAAKLATDAWGSNQYSFPIAGNIIEPASSAGGSGSAGTNLIFINGVTVVRPSLLDGLDPAGKNAKGTINIAIEIQKQCSLALLATVNGEAAASVPGDVTGSCTSLTSTQVSRPAAIRQDIYVSYGDPSKTEKQRLAEVGTSCPPSARKVAWLTVSKSAFITGLQTRDHPLFDTAARAINAGQSELARLQCPKAG